MRKLSYHFGFVFGSIHCARNWFSLKPMPYRRHNRKWFCFLSHLSFAFSYIQWKTISFNCALSFVLIEMIMVFTLGWVVVGCVCVWERECVRVIVFFICFLCRATESIVCNGSASSPIAIYWNVVSFNAFLCYLAPYRLYHRSHLRPSLFQLFLFLLEITHSNRLHSIPFIHFINFTGNFSSFFIWDTYI